MGLRAPMKPPSPLLMMMEGRAFSELAACCLALPSLKSLPKGDGHPVLVLPGFGTNDLWTLPLRRFLRLQGYRAEAWKLGTNLGPSKELAERMLMRVNELYQATGRRVSLVGWSLGGIYARELARARPEQTRQVITLGSPFNGDPKANHCWRLIEWLAGLNLDAVDPVTREKLKEPPPVPSTAIYSRSDGMTAWQCCLERPGPMSENIEVQGSHGGLPHNPDVMRIIAERLARPETCRSTSNGAVSRRRKRVCPLRPVRGRGRLHPVSGRELPRVA